MDIALWGVAISALALLLFSLIDFALVGLPERMREGDVPAAVVLAAAKLGVSIILAAALAV
jgi:putative membrane protein